MNESEREGTTPDRSSHVTVLQNGIKVGKSAQKNRTQSSSQKTQVGLSKKDVDKIDSKGQAKGFVSSECADTETLKVGT